MTTGDRIKEERKKKNLTLEELSVISRISKGNLSLFENNKGLPSASALISLCESLDVSADYLLFGEDKNPSTSNKTIQVQEEESAPEKIGELSFNQTLLSELVYLVKETVSSKNEVILTKEQVITLQDKYMTGILSEVKDHLATQKEYILHIKK